MTKLEISLSAEELDRFLAEAPTLGLATVSPGGWPHAVPLWFVWLRGVAFMNTTLGNATVRNLDHDPRVTGCVDDGETYDDLRGALLRGRVERAGDDPRLREVEHLWSSKYLSGNPVPFGTWKRRVWLRLEPERITSWDFRKI